MKFLSEKPEFSLFLFIAIFFVAVNNKSSAVEMIHLPSNEKIPAVFVFGDSIVDTGNNNNIKSTAKCNFPPYGRDFTGGKPTGRFSNGRVPSDFIAEAFGVKKYLPAYLDPSLKLEDLLTGVSFASGGGGYDPLTATLPPAYSLSDQLAQFKEYIQKIKSGVGEERSSNIISKSIFVSCTGSNDVLNTYYSTPLRKYKYDINSYLDFLVSSASGFFQELYGLGARRFGVIGLPPIGCLPAQRTVRGGLQRGCVDFANEAAVSFNSKLSSAILSLNKTLSDAMLIYLDVYNPLLSLIQNPTKYGFEVSNKGCCGTGKIEVTYLCNNFDDPLTCKDDTKYVFWDSYHPTENAYEILVNLIIPSISNVF